MHGIASKPVPAPRAARGFSLVEMLLAVFILGIGVISIAALFPAGIALQRQATDDTLGPIIAKNAFATIRSKLSREDFGGFNDFGLAPVYQSGVGPAGTIRPVGGADIPQLGGDWGWMRPAFYTNNNNAAVGTIDIFSAGFARQQAPFNLPARPQTPGISWATEMPDGHPGGPLFGIPYNRSKYPLFDIAAADPAAVPASLDLQALLEPAITFSQSERSFPQRGSGDVAVPTYHWECMFRRTGGKVEVAVFVFRVSVPGGDTQPYATRALNNSVLVGTPAAPGGSFETGPQTPPIPALYLAPNFGQATSWPNRSNATAARDEIPGTQIGSSFAPTLVWDDWQLPNAWWIDNHGTVHRVLQGRSRSTQGPVRLQRPIPILPNSPIHGFNPAPAVSGTYPALPEANNRRVGPNGWIEGIWFVPQRDARGNILTPIFAAVEEL
jgi:prepilin-type N-terminal cleavage/methylation domain-containing protein